MGGQHALAFATCIEIIETHDHLLCDFFLPILINFGDALTGLWICIQIDGG
jgi:hypothetical protein